MYSEVGEPHHLPHFHAYYQDDVWIFYLDPIALMAGRLHTRQQRLVEASAELHQAEPLEDWERLQNGRRPFAIKPLS